MADNEESSRDYYYAHEVAKKLGVAEHDLWRMRLRSSWDDGKGVFPKQMVEDIARSWSEVLCFEDEEKYYRLDQFAIAIARDPKKLADRAIEFHEQSWISEEEAEQIIAEIRQRQEFRDENIRGRLLKPVLKRDAEKQSADILIQNLREQVDISLEENQSAESRIQGIQEELDKERAAKEQKAEDANDFEKWYEQAQEELNEEKERNRRLIENGQNDESTTSAELENAKQRIRECGEENESLKMERANLTATMELMKSEVHLLAEIRRLLDSEREN